MILFLSNVVTAEAVSAAPEARTEPAVRAVLAVLSIKAAITPDTVYAHVEKLGVVAVG